MHKAVCNATADKGKQFVLTEYGYEKTPDKVKPERKIGEPIKGFEDKVPASWIEKGYVKEKEVGSGSQVEA